MESIELNKRNEKDGKAGSSSTCAPPSPASGNPISPAPDSSAISSPFKAELFFLIAHFLEGNKATSDVADLLKEKLETQGLLTPRYDWTGKAHVKTFESVQKEVGVIHQEHLLELCFRLCSLAPESRPPGIRTLFGSQVFKARPPGPFEPHQPKVLDLLKQRHYRSKIPSERTWQGYLSKKISFLRRTLGHLSGVYCLAFDRTGRFVFTGADDLLIKCWRVSDGRLVHTFRGASSEISDLTISHDNKLLAAGSCDKIIRVWCLQSAAPVAVLSKHTGTITAIHFCPYSTDMKFFHLASTSGDGTVSFWRYKFNEHEVAEFEEAPTRYHEKIRPGQAQMLCASYSPGGIFFCVGSADHNVRVYQMNGVEGPVRILEEELHQDRVACIQWCNLPDHLRFISGSKDGMAIIWTYKAKKWQTLTLNMKTGDNRESSPSTRLAFNSQRGNRNVTENRQAASSAAAAVSLAQATANECRVTMVAWSLDDSIAITAVSDATLKLWDSRTGKLQSTLRGHEDEIFVLEPHPTSWNLLLSAAHDGQIFVWDLLTSKSLFKHKNMVEDQAGHAAIYDAKWSPDGLTIAASDSHGHLLFAGHGSSEKYDKLPMELFFHTDYRPLLRDSFQNVVDEQTQVPPHLLPPPFLVDSEGSPYPAYIQKFVPGREKMTESEALVPGGPEPSFNISNQQLQEQAQQQQQPGSSGGAPRLAEFHGESSLSSSSSLNNSQRLGSLEIPRRSDTENSNPEIRVSGDEDSNHYNNSALNSSNVVLEKRPVIRKDLDLPMVNEHIKQCNASSVVEVDTFNIEVNKTLSDHDYTPRSQLQSKDRHKKSKNSGRRDNRNNSGAAPPGASARTRREYADDEEVEEENANDLENGDADHSSDESLDESDMSSIESTTAEDSSDHSNWGSDGNEDEEDNHRLPPLPPKKKSPPSKKKRDAAQKCREIMLKHPSDISEEYSPSPWLSEAFPKKSPYFPQINDVLIYFKQGHQKYIDLVKSRKAYEVNMKEQEWMRKKNINEVCLVKVMNMKFEIRPPRLCILKLAILSEQTLQPTGENFSIKYHDMNDVVDFLVLFDIYKSSKGKQWKNGDRIRCQIDDCWWKGTVKKVEHHDANKRSPFLSIFCHWDNGEKEYLSPWDIEALDPETADLPDGTPVTAEQLKSCLYQPREVEWNSMGLETECRRISEAFETIMGLAIAEPFNYPVDLTAYPEYMLDVEYPMDLNLIKSRIDNHFYRRIDAVQYDLQYIAANAASFNRPKSDIVKNAKIITKLALKVVGDSSKSSRDVSSMYHHLVETFEWSDHENEEDDGEENGNEEDTDSEEDKEQSSPSKHKSPPVHLNPKKWKHDCNELLNRMVAHPLSVPFREPVSEIEFPDYHRCITTPMDISTVREFLLVGEYESPLNFQKDILLIFKNSREYNTDPKAKILTMTDKLEDWFEQELIGIVKEWRRTNRRLSMAKNKHKVKESKKSKFVGKGKGKGKGQSNRIKRRKQYYEDSEEEDNNGDDASSDNEERTGMDEDDEEFSPSTSTSRRPRPVRSAGAKRRLVESDDEDFDEQYPVKRKKLTPTKRDTQSNYRRAGRNSRSETAIGGDKISPATSNASSSRRLSTRVPKPPARYQKSDEDISPSKRSSDRTTKPLASMQESDSEDDQNIIPQRLASAASAAATAASSSLNEERPKRRRKPLRSENYAYFDDEEDEEEDDLPLRKIPKATAKRATFDEEEDDDDLPLARIQHKEKSMQRTLIPESTPQKSKRKVKTNSVELENFEEWHQSDSDDEDDKPLRGQRSRRAAAEISKKRLAEQNAHDQSDEEPVAAQRTNGVSRDRQVMNGNARRRKKESDQSESEFEGDENEESEDEPESEEEEVEDDLDDDFIVDDEDVPLSRSKRSRRGTSRTNRRTTMQPKQNSSKRAVQALDSESEHTSARRPSRLANRNQGLGEETPRRGGRRSAIGKQSYFESDNEDSARENRRPLLRHRRGGTAAKRSKARDIHSSEEDEEEIEYGSEDERPKKRLKPNPRII